MRIYHFRFEIPHMDNAEVVEHYLAKDNNDFIKHCVSWAHECEEPKKPRANATPEEWRSYHDDQETYHKFMAHALAESEFDPEVVDMRASWTSEEISGEDLEHLYRLNIFERPAE